MMSLLLLLDVSRTQRKKGKNIKKTRKKKVERVPFVSFFLSRFLIFKREKRIPKNHRFVFVYFFVTETGERELLCWRD